MPLCIFLYHSLSPSAKATFIRRLLHEERDLLEGPLALFGGTPFR